MVVRGGVAALVARLGLGDHRLALQGVPLPWVIAVGDDVAAEPVRKGCVVGAELVVGRARAARLAIAEPGGAERSGHAYEWDTTMCLTCARVRARKIGRRSRRGTPRPGPTTTTIATGVGVGAAEPAVHRLVGGCR